MHKKINNISFMEAINKEDEEQEMINRISKDIETNKKYNKPIKRSIVFEDELPEIKITSETCQIENGMPISDKTRKEMLQYGAQYKQAHPHAKNRQIKRAVYSKFKIKP